MPLILSQKPGRSNVRIHISLFSIMFDSPSLILHSRTLAKQQELHDAIGVNAKRVTVRHALIIVPLSSNIFGSDESVPLRDTQMTS
jgi:hypothetical protein